MLLATSYWLLDLLNLPVTSDQKPVASSQQPVLIVFPPEADAPFEELRSFANGYSTLPPSVCTFRIVF